MIKRIVSVCGGMLAMSSAWALPTLQVDVPVNGVYNTADETTYATTPQFNLRALYNGSSLSTTFYISAAITPMLGQSTPAPSVGSFRIDGVTYTTSSGMQWGTPPVAVMDTPTGGGPGNIAPHDIFPTYYAEIAFHFDSSHFVSAYNTADGTTSPGNLLYHDFSIDVAGLFPGYAVHFDLYDEAFKHGSPTIDDFAPFSHDVQSGGGSVPDGGLTLAMLGFALASTEVMRRSFSRKRHSRRVSA